MKWNFADKPKFKVLYDHCKVSRVWYKSNQRGLDDKFLNKIGGGMTL